MKKRVGQPIINNSNFSSPKIPLPSVCMSFPIQTGDGLYGLYAMSLQIIQTNHTNQGFVIIKFAYSWLVCDFLYKPGPVCMVCINKTYKPSTVCMVCMNIWYKPLTVCMVCMDISYKPLTVCMVCMNIAYKPSTVCMVSMDMSYKPSHGKCW